MRAEWLLALDERNNAGRRWFSKRKFFSTGISVLEANLIVHKAFCGEHTTCSHMKLLKPAGRRQKGRLKNPTENAVSIDK